MELHHNDLVYILHANLTKHWHRMPRDKVRVIHMQSKGKVL